MGHFKKNLTRALCEIKPFRQRFHFILWALVALWNLGAPKEAVATPHPWNVHLKPVLLQAKLPAQSYGIEVRELYSNKVLFAENADLAFNPASSIKILTAAAALAKLGLDHRFYTYVLKSANNICLKGGGDPSLVSERMWLLVQGLHRKGLLKIQGDLIADESQFKLSTAYGKAFKGDHHRAFVAPISALSINFNSVTIHVTPTELGKPPHVSLEPSLPSYFTIQNQAKTSLGKKNTLRVLLQTQNSGVKIIVQGAIGRDHKPEKVYRAIPDPSMYTAQVFAELFQRSGGSFQGTIRKGICPKEAQEVLQFKSKPFSQVVADLNKFSNNFIAEMILKSMEQASSSQNGLDLIRLWLAQSGIDAPELVLKNASGLSRETRISAHTLTSIVRLASLRLSIAPEFLHSLGIAAMDGTLQHRFEGTPGYGRVRAKSGSLKNAVSLTGLIDYKTSRPLVFTFLFRTKPGQAWRAQKLEERLILKILSLNSIDSPRP